MILIVRIMKFALNSNVKILANIHLILVDRMLSAKQVLIVQFAIVHQNGQEIHMLNVTNVCIFGHQFINYIELE